MELIEIIDGLTNRWSWRRASPPSA